MTADAALELEAATSAVEAERLNHASNLAASLCGNVDDQRTDTSHSLRTARGRATDAADHLEACKQALTQVESGIAQPERLLREAEEKVVHAAKAVLSDETQHWPQEMQTLLDDFTTKLVAFNWLVRRGVVDDAAEQQSPRHADPLLRNGPSARILRRCQDIWISWRGNELPLSQVYTNHPAAQQWQQVLEQLQHDADAPLP